MTVTGLRPTPRTAFALPDGAAATEPPEQRGLARDGVRLLVSEPDRVTHARFRDLGRFLRAGDLIVVNTSATLPAALDGTRSGGRPVVVHCSTPHAAHTPRPARTSHPATTPPDPTTPHDTTTPPDTTIPHDRTIPHDATALRDATIPRSATAPHDTTTWVVELRLPDGSGPARDGVAGERVVLPGAATLTLRAAYPETGAPGHGTGRLWLGDFTDTGADVERYLARYGRPITYSYLRDRWPLRAYQPVFAREPGSAEMASAGRPFTPELVVDLVTRGITIAPVLLHTAVSSLEAAEAVQPERFRVPAATARLVTHPRRAGGRVIAVGTTVTRALETVARPDGTVTPGQGWTDLTLGPDRPARVVDALVTGWHAPEASHLLLLEAVGGPGLVARAYRAALRAATAGTSSATAACSYPPDRTADHRRVGPGAFQRGPDRVIVEGHEEVRPMSVLLTAALLTAALDYAAAGIPVLPLHTPTGHRCSCRRPDCDRPGKHPRWHPSLITGGLHDASADPERIVRWWTRWPAANVGLRTGTAVDVCDVDTVDGLRALIDLLATAVAGPVVRTGSGGHHVYFTATGAGNRVGLLPGVDWRGAGGYVVAPPSLHASGARYRWSRGLDIPPPACPPPLRALLFPPVPPRDTGPVPVRHPARYAAAALIDEARRVAEAPVGQRNNTLYRAARNIGELAATDVVDERDVVDALSQAATSAGLGRPEIARTIRSGLTAGRRRPRGQRRAA